MLTPKFEIGQKVFCAGVNWSSKQVTCPDCLGTLKWTVSCPSGEVFQHPCNTCTRGWETTGTVTEYGDYPHIVERTIGSIRIDTAAEEAPISYMCVETGVGSGNVYYESALFATRHEAEAWTIVELERVKGFRQNEELARRERNKKGSLIHGAREKKGKI